MHKSEIDTLPAGTGLRERKRRETHWRIVDEAMKLVEKRGFDSVTVEEICAAAGISRRTFFNYMDSKDEAVLGSFPFELSAAAYEAIANTQADNVLDLIFSQLEVRPDLLSREHLHRRRVILKQHPSLAGAAYERKSEVLMRLGVAVDKHFALFPEDRKLPHVAQAIEVNAIIDFFYASVAMYLSNPDFPTEVLGVDALRAAATIHTALARELTW